MTQTMKIEDDSEPLEKQNMKDEKEGLAKILALHSALVTKRANLNQLLWQAPVISLTAQAFLLNIAFDGGRSSFYRIISGCMATLVGLLSWQLFLRHSAFEKETTVELCDMEKTFLGRSVHEVNTLERYSCFAHLFKSRTLWKAGLFIISWIGLLPMFKWVALASGLIDH
jgi:hypothetical protein